MESGGPNQQNAPVDSGKGTAAASTSSSSPSPPSCYVACCTVHDLLSLGEIRNALLLSSGRLPAPPCGSAGETSNQSKESTKRKDRRDAQEEVRRLPLLLRLLSSSRPLASVPTIPGLETAASSASTNTAGSGTNISLEGDMNNNDPADQSESKQQYQQQQQSEADVTVPLLEQVAAYHPQSELIEQIASNYAIDATRNNVGRVGAVSEKKRLNFSNQKGGGDGGSGEVRLLQTSEWDTKELRAALAGKVVGGGKRGKKRGRSQEDDADGPPAAGGGGGGAKDGKDEIITSDDEQGAETDYEAMAAHAMAAEAIAIYQSDAPLDASVGATAEPSSRMVAELLPDSGSNKRQKTGVGEKEQAGLASSSFLASAHAAAQDSTEAAVKRTLREITSLVLSSLEPIEINLSSLTGRNGGKALTEGIEGLEDIKSDDGRSSVPSAVAAASDAGEDGDKKDDGDGGEDDGGGGGRRGDAAANSSILIQLKPDSLLAEVACDSKNNGEDDEEGEDGAKGGSNIHGYGAGTELTATISSLMQQAPALRHRHLANALCRAAVPQAASIISSLASNCPQASPCLLAGCIDASIAATASSVPGEDASLSKIIEASRLSVRSIAELSTSSAWAVANTLLQYKTMKDVALAILIKIDTSAAVSTMLESLLLEVDTRRKRFASRSKLQGGKKGSRRRRRIRPTQEMRSEFSLVANEMPWIVGALVNDNELARKARKCILDSLESIYNGEDIPSLGKAILTIRALSLLVYFVGIGSGSSYGSGSAFVQSSMDAIDILNGKFSDKESDELRILSICACLLTCSKFPPIAEAKQTFLNSPSSSACAACLLGLLEATASNPSNSFAARVAACFSSQDSTELCRLVVGRLVNGCFEDGDGTILAESDADAFFNTCRWGSTKIDSATTEESTKQSFSSIIVLNDGTRRGNLSNSDLEKQVALIVDDEDRCLQAVQDSCLPTLMQNTVAAALSEDGTSLPLVLPLRLEALAQKLSWKRSDLFDPMSEASRCQFLTQLLYSLLFLDQAPSSPFVTDPRSLPLAETLVFCQESRSVCDTVFLRLQKLVTKLVPEAVALTNPNEADMDRMAGPSLSGQVTISMVTDAINACGVDGVDKAAYGRRAELMFLKARADYPSSDVDTAVACALLSPRHLPPRAYTYSLLCKDPLLILKCHLFMWKCDGLRRIILSILRRLLDANKYVTMQEAPTEDVGFQMLSARDALVARCLLLAGSKNFQFDVDTTSKKIAATSCPMTIALVRSMVSNHRGIVSMLIKQGLPTEAVDWLIEIAPECLCDAELLTGCLSERNTLTAAERMFAADASLRIAIAHGARDEVAAQQLAYSALNVLVSSFFLSLGPIGVPVNIIHEDDGNDVTQICRRATFRMLAAIQSIQGNPDRVALKNEVRRALSKMASMCMSESALSGVSGSVALRRKALLKDIWDAVVRASNALGGGLQA